MSFEEEIMSTGNCADFVQATGAIKSVHWDAGHVLLDGDVKWLFGVSGVHDAVQAPPSQKDRNHEQINDICVVLSGTVMGSPSLFVLRKSEADTAFNYDGNPSAEGSRSKSTSDAPVPSAASVLSLVARSSAVSDKEITRISASSRSENGQVLIIVSSQDGCIRAFKLGSVLQSVFEEFPYKLELAWMISAVRSEIKEWCTQPLPHMTTSGIQSVFADELEQNETPEQTWLQSENSSAVPNQLRESASKSPSVAGNKLRAAARNVAAIASVSHVRDLWLLGGLSTLNDTTRWYNMDLNATDVKRIVEADSDAIHHAVSSCDILPSHNACTRNNPQGLEVLACSVAISFGQVVLAGYIDGTFRIWKQISSNAPPLDVRQSVLSMIHSGDARLVKFNVVSKYFCFRTLKLSDSSIADVIMTSEGSLAVACDAMGVQFVVSIGGKHAQHQHEKPGFHWFNDLQVPFSFTVEPTVQVACMFLHEIKNHNQPKCCCLSCFFLKCWHSQHYSL